VAFLVLITAAHDANSEGGPRGRVSIPQRVVAGRSLASMFLEAMRGVVVVRCFV